MPTDPVTPNIDQVNVPGAQISANFSTISPPNFVFVVCQHGAENKIKSIWNQDSQPFRLAFSRPGLLTFKLAPEKSKSTTSGQSNPAHPKSPRSNPPETKSGHSKSVHSKSKSDAGVIDRPSGILIRQSGFAFGQVRGSSEEDVSASKLVAQAIELASSDWDRVHIFARDLQLPGARGFEPGRSEVALAVAEEFRKQLPNTPVAAGIAPTSETTGNIGDRILDIVLVEPNQWIVGFHVAEQLSDLWPGGSFPVAAPDGMISRAYLKMAEALAWSELPIRAGDHIVEIGSSPGGASQRLLDLGLNVTGVDPAEMDPLLTEHPRFDHWRSKSSAVRRKRYSKFRWLAADANVAPNYTLDAVEDIVTYPDSKFQGLILTLKLSSYDLIDQFDEHFRRVTGWGFRRVAARQLSFNRKECCLIAQK